MATKSEANYTLSKVDFINLLINRSKTNLSYETALKFYDSIKLVVLEELKINGSVILPDFIEVSVKQTGGKDIRIHSFVTGKPELCYQKPKMKINVKARPVFERDVNDRDFSVQQKTQLKKKKDTTIQLSKRPRKQQPSIETQLIDLMNKKMQ